MGPPETEVTCCPRCKKLVEAKDYMDRFYLGLTDSILQQIRCRCGYKGLPIVLSKEDYIKWKSST
jgi:hypothetical protein